MKTVLGAAAALITILAANAASANESNHLAQPVRSTIAVKAEAGSFNNTLQSSLSFFRSASATAVNDPARNAASGK
jgi:hypothetical protein